MRTASEMTEMQALDAHVPELPPDVIAVLLQYVPQTDRLTSCALVSTAWRAASCASISSITVTCSKQQHANNAFSWLTKHGQTVTTARMTVSERAEKLCLDCELQRWSWLNDLRLTGFNLRQGPAASDFPQYSPDIAALMARSATIRCKSSSRLGELTALTRLDLDGCSVPDDLAALSALTGLQHLAVSVMTHDPAGVSGLPFMNLQQLTYLQLGVDVCDSTCEHLSRLTSLRELHISKYAVLTHQGLSHIGSLQQLTQLRINCAAYTLEPRTIPGFSALSGLQHLEVLDCKELNPAVLAAMTGLQHLAITDTPLHPRGVSPSAAVQAATLLSLLPTMQQLTCLQLMDCLSWPQAPQAYAALTAPPKLARLILRSCQLPPGGCQHMFERPGQLPQLTQLVLLAKFPQNVPLEAGGIAKVAGSCPALRQLDVDLGRQGVEDLRPLTQLSTLTWLSAGDICDAGLEVLGQLPRLRYLDVERAKAVTATGLSHLTALTCLTQLRLPGSAAVLGTHYLRGLHLKSRADQEGIINVHTQLARLLASSTASSSAPQGSCCSRTARINHLQDLDHRWMGEMAELRQLYYLATEADWHSGDV